MLSVFIFSSLYILSSGIVYKKLSKYSSVKVEPKTHVYLDISSFSDYDIIKLELSMNLWRTSYTQSYSFSIGQVWSSNPPDSSLWDSLPTVSSGGKNHSCGFTDYCYFNWNETKRSGANYLFIIPSEPYTGFFSRDGNYIKVNHLGGLSTGAIVGIVFGCIGGVVLIVIIIYCCCCRQKPNYGITNPPAALTSVQPIVPTTVEPIITVPPIAPVTVQPIVTYGPPPPQPYVHPVVY